MTKAQLERYVAQHRLATIIWRRYPGGILRGGAPGPSKHCCGPALWQKVARWCRQEHPQEYDRMLRWAKGTVNFPNWYPEKADVEAVLAWELNQREMRVVRASSGKRAAEHRFYNRRNRRRIALGKAIRRRFPKANVDPRLVWFNHRVALIKWCRENHPRIYHQLAEKL